MSAPAKRKAAPAPRAAYVDLGHVVATSQELDVARRAACLMSEGGEADAAAAFTRCVRALERAQGYLDILRSDIEGGAK